MEQLAALVLSVDAVRDVARSARPDAPVAPYPEKSGPVRAAVARALTAAARTLAPELIPPAAGVKTG
jgi:hypothetical protein